MTIFCLYVSKGCDFGHLVESLKNYEFNKEKNTFLIGDLNFDTSESNDLTKYMLRLQFCQLVSRATHLDGHILDQIYALQDKSHLVEVKHHHVYYSDHDGLLLNMKDENIQ